MVITIAIITLTTVILSLAGFSLDKAIGIAAGLIGVPLVYILAIGAAIYKKFHKSDDKWITVSPGHTIRNNVV